MRSFNQHHADGTFAFTAAGGLEPAATTTIAEGGKVTFTATAVGTGPITYAWNYDGNPTGATGSSLTLTGVSTNQAGTYTVTATGDYRAARNEFQRDSHRYWPRNHKHPLPAQFDQPVHLCGVRHNHLSTPFRARC